MIKKIAWDAFKNTGNINAFMEFKQIENLEKEIEGLKNGEHKNEGDYTFRE